MEVAEIWKRYKCDPTDVEMRNRLIDQYFPLVHHHARTIASRFRSPVIDYDDLVSAGFFGMLDAFESFDPDRGIRFEAFSALRIRGAMFDETRRLDQLSRLSRSREKLRVKVIAQLRSSLGRQPTDDEVAKKLGFETSRQMADNIPLGLLSMEQLSNDNGASFREDFIDREDPPDRRMERQDQLNLIVQSLSKSERMIVLFYYYENLTMREIGKALDISESRVSQLHSRVVARLEEALANRRDEFFKE